MEELFECATQDMGLTKEQLAERWTKPFNIVTDIFQVRSANGELVPYTPYEYSVDFLNNGFYDIDVDRCALKSRQIGFSTIAEIEAIITAMTFDNQEVSFISHQFTASKKLVEACGTIIREAKYPLPFKKGNVQKQRIKCDTGSTIVPYSSNPSSIRGDSSIRVYLDEFAFVKNQEETMDAVEPKLSRGGQITMMSTPLRADDLFMRTYNDMRNGDMPGNAMFCPLFVEEEVDISQPLTSQTLNPICPDIDLSRVESVRSKSINRFLQEYMCQPIDEINAYYPYDLILGCTENEPVYNSKHDNSYIVMGLDHALVHDETSFVINQIIDGVNNIIYVETTQAEYDEQLKRVEQLFRQFNVQKIRPDATGEMGIQVERDLRKKFGYCVEGVKYTNTVKNEMALRLKYLMQNTNNNIRPCIQLPDHPELIAQLHGIQIEVTKAGNTQFSGKHGGGLDDIVNALWLSLPPEHIDHMKSLPIVKSGTAPSVKRQKTPTNTYHATTSKGKIRYRSKGR